MLEQISTNDYPAMYRSLRSSFLALQRQHVLLELTNSKLRSALYNIKADTNDEQSRSDATIALRADGMGDLE